MVEADPPCVDSQMASGALTHADTICITLITCLHRIVHSSSTNLVHDELEGVDPGSGVRGSLGGEVHSTVIAHLFNHNDEVDFVNKKWFRCTSD